MSRSRWVLLVILLVGAALRLVGLDGLPPGLQHDEVAHWLINQGILAGRHGVYFEEAYGHEAGFHYIQAAFSALVGDHALGLRLPSAYAGILVVSVGYALAKKLFSERVALVNAALVAVLFWPIFFSRLAVRAIALPLLSGAAAYLLWRGLETGKVACDTRSVGWRWLAGAGVVAGLCLHTYMAARAVPLIVVLFVAYLALVDPRRVRHHWRGLVLMIGLMALVAAPLVGWLLAHPGAEHRIGEVDRPLDSLLAGDPLPVVENGAKLLGFFGWRGDPLVRQNLPNRPVYGPIGAVLFYVGLLMAAWRWRRPENAFVLIWLAGSVVPSLVTVDAPSSIRCINALPLLGVPVGLTLDEVASRLSRLANGLRWRRVQDRATAIWVTVVLVTTILAAQAWRQEPEVHFVWQTALKEAAAYLDKSDIAGPVVVAGWTPDSMDPPTMELYLRRSDLVLRYVNPMQALLFPAGGGTLIRPAILPVEPALEADLVDLGTVLISDQAFSAYRLANVVTLPVTERAYVRFDSGVSYLGHRLAWDGAGFGLVSYWQADGPLADSVQFFVHLFDSAGNPVGQHDGLGAPARHWQSGDVIAQAHRLSVPPGVYEARLGLYDRATLVRSTYTVGGVTLDSVDIGQVIVP